MLDQWDVEGGLYPPLPGLTIPCSPNATWSYTLPSVRYGKLTVLPQPLQIRVVFFPDVYEDGSIPTLPELTTLAAPMLP
jgi:hypothetical protein